MHRALTVLALKAAGVLGLAQLGGGPPSVAATSLPTDTARLKTFSGIGKEVPLLEAGKEAELFHREGTGCLTHMWVALDERVHIRVYVGHEMTR